MAPDLAGGPALDRLTWVLDGLSGRPGWGEDADAVIGPPLSDRVPPADFATRIQQRGARLGPAALVGLAADGTTGSARLRTEHGIEVLHATVEEHEPHRLVDVWVAPWILPGVTPNLPADFGSYDVPPAPDARLVVFSGVPGVGKSSIADAVGRASGMPVYAIDWLLGALTPFGGQHLDELWEIGEELLTTLAVRALSSGQSAIIDAPAESIGTRERWAGLAERAGAGFVAVWCECSDPDEHRARVQGRSRGIPGWHDAGDWDNVVRRLASFPPWPPDALRLDTNQPIEANVSAVLDRLAAGA